MRTVMLGYWVILVGVILDIVGTLWDVVDPLTGEQALGGTLTPEILKFLERVMDPRRGRRSLDGGTDKRTRRSAALPK